VTIPANAMTSPATATLSIPGDAFLEKLDLPRGLERQLVHERDREYDIRGSESRTLSIVGTFRVVWSRDLRDQLS